MILKKLAAIFSVIIFGAILTGCAGMHYAMPTAEDCANGNTTARLKSGEYSEKVDNFLIIQDASSSMIEKWQNDKFTYESSKLDYSKELVQCLNNTLPDSYNAQAGMRVFGLLKSEDGLVYGMDRYSKAGLGNAVQGLSATANLTPMARVIDDGSADLTGMLGDGAAIIFSDGLNTEAPDPVAAAAAMKEKYGQNICIYTVLIGNDPEGKATLEQIADAGECGFATDLATIGNAAGMEKFVNQVFLEKSPDRDSDGDGVFDRFDKCPNTPRGIKVDKDGCPIPMKQRISIALYVQFDLDKANVKQEFHDPIEKVANFLKAYPEATGVLEGHTCSLGTDAYNMELSKRRAENVKAYLVNKFNIKPARLTTKGYGESRPVASNETEESRKKNRRVVADIVTFTLK